jgi:outer membrane protein assembly factor BamB
LLIGVLMALPMNAGLAETPPLSHPSIAKRMRGADWPSFLGPNRNCKSVERGLPTEWPKNGPPIVWQTAIGTGHAAPTISNGRLFHFARFDDTVRLTCFNAESGEILWICEYPTDYVDILGFNNGTRASPVVDGDRVYTLGAEGVLQCVRVEDGSPLWRIQSSKEFDVVKNWFGAGSTPLVWNDLLIVNIGGSPPGGLPDISKANGRIEPNGSALIAFDKLTGSVCWKAGDELASYASPVAARIGSRDIVFMFARGGLLAVDLAKGEVIAHFPWRARQLASVNATTPVVVGDEVFISEAYGPGGALVRLKENSFEEIWTDANRRRKRAMALQWITPIEHEGYLYGSSGYDPPEIELRCVERKTGKVLWGAPETTRASLLLVDGVLVSLSEDGTIRLIRATPERYDEIAEWKYLADDGTPLLKYPAWTGPALAHGLLYVQGVDRLLCIELIPEK